jgi:CBS domain-containing protein
MKVESIMSPQVHVCRGSETVLSALRSMREHGCDYLAVVDHCAMVGIVTDECIRAALQRTDTAPANLRLAEIMTDDVRVAYPDTPVAEAAAVMRGLQLRRMPVVDDALRPLGLLDLADIPQDLYI